MGINPKIETQAGTGIQTPYDFYSGKIVLASSCRMWGWWSKDNFISVYQFLPRVKRNKLSNCTCPRTYMYACFYIQLSIIQQMCITKSNIGNISGI